MKEFTRTTTSEDERGEGRTPEENTSGFRQNRFERTGNTTIDDIGVHPNLKLREGDDLTAMIAAIRADAAKKYGFTVVEHPDSQDAEVYEEPVALADNESLEALTNVEKACLDAMKADFDRGIVRIDDDADKDAYQAALKEDKSAGQSWGAIQSRLLAGKACLLKKAVELSQLTGSQDGTGALLVGVYENGELAIRQRSQEIVNARWTKDWQDGQSDKGELRLLFHPEAVAQKTGRWAKAVEIIHAVKAAGYHVPADATEKKGQVAASEAVTAAHYVKDPYGNEYRDAMLECPDNTPDSASVRVVGFDPDPRYTNVHAGFARNRDGYRGAVLWLRG